MEGPFSICTPEATRLSNSMPSRGVTKGSMALATTVTSGTFYPASLRADPGLLALPNEGEDGHSLLETLSKGCAC